jgi:hypothetical protein
MGVKAHMDPSFTLISGCLIGMNQSLFLHSPPGPKYEVNIHDSPATKSAILAQAYSFPFAPFILPLFPLLFLSPLFILPYN